MKKNWLSENIKSIIALSFIWFAMYVFRIILLKQISASETTAINIVNSVTNILFLVMGYYFGSSEGSKNKQDQLSQMSNKSAGVIENAKEVNITNETKP